MNAGFADLFVPEDETVLAARHRSADLGVAAVSTGTGATLRVLAAAVGAKAVVELGTGAGVSGLHLLAGMAPDGVLTSIDVEPEHQRAAKAAFQAAGIAPGRTRLINGRALDVLSRLTDGAYDLVVVDADRTEFPEYVAAAVRVLRIGGVLAVVGAMGGGKVADPTERDPETVAVREAIRWARDAEDLAVSLLPVGDGLLLAARR